MTSMALSTTIKHMCISLGLYRPLRWLDRHVLRKSQLQSLNNDTTFYQSILPENALCFDVGANIGTKSEAMLRTGASVIAFEPNPMVLPELKARCLHEKRWKLVEAALGSEAAIATFYARQSHGSSGLVEKWGDDVVRTFHVPVVTLDAAIKTFGLPFYCKVDVEGAELMVLQGLSEPLPLMSLEFHIND